MLNLCVDWIDEPGVMLETRETLDPRNLDWFKECKANNELEIVSLEDGLKKLQIAVDNCEGSLDQSWAEKKAEFLAEIQNKVGTFYLWNVEDDLDLMFVEQGEQI